MALTYWERRAVQRVLDAQKREDAAMRTVARAVKQALRELQDAIDRIGRNFARAYDLTEDEARDLLAQPADREEYTRLLGEIAQLPDGTEKTRLMARAASGGYAYRISQQEAMQAHVEAQAALLGVEIERQTQKTLEAVGADTVDSVRQDTAKAGFSVDTTGSNLSAVEEIMSTPWNGANYSTRVWTNTDALVKLLDDTIMSGFLSGKHPRKIAAEVAEKMNVAYYQAERLVRTEVSRLQNAVALEELKRAGIAEYQWVAALDKRTCQVCGELDAKHFPVDKAKTGETLPPRHPFCRCTIVMHEAAQEGQTRFARDADGQGMKVPAGTTYEQWKAAMAANQKADALRALRELATSRKNLLAGNPALALPNAGMVTIDARKFTEYLFGGTTKAGLVKGVAFSSRLGYNNNNWELLMNEILIAARLYPAVQKKTNQYGISYEQEVILNGLKETPANVIIGWIVNAAGTKMTTVYITEVKKNGR